MATNGYRSTAAQRREAEAARAAKLAERDARWARLSFADFLAEYAPDLASFLEEDPETAYARWPELLESAEAMHALLIAEQGAAV